MASDFHLPSSWMDCCFVHVGAEECSGTAWAKAARANEFWRNAGCFVEPDSCMSKGVCDVVCFDSSLAAIVCVIGADGCVVGNWFAADVHDKTGECLAWAKDWIGSGPVAYLFTSDGILLVSEREGGICDVPDVYFIQRSRRGFCSHATDCEGESSWTSAVVYLSHFFLCRSLQCTLEMRTRPVRYLVWVEVVGVSSSPSNRHRRQKIRR